MLTVRPLRPMCRQQRSAGRVQAPRELCWTTRFVTFTGFQRSLSPFRRATSAGPGREIEASTDGYHQPRFTGDPLTGQSGTDSTTLQLVGLTGVVKEDRHVGPQPLEEPLRGILVQRVDLDRPRWGVLRPRGIGPFGRGVQLDHPDPVGVLPHMVDIEHRSDHLKPPNIGGTYVFPLRAPTVTADQRRV